MYEPHWRLPFTLNLRSLYLLRFSSFANIFGRKLGITDVLFVSMSSKSFLIGIFCPWCFSIFNLAMRVLIGNRVLIKLRKSLIKLITIWLKLHFVYVYHSLDYSFLSQFSSLFWYISGKPDSKSFSSLNR